MAIYDNIHGGCQGRMLPCLVARKTLTHKTGFAI